MPQTNNEEKPIESTDLFAFERCADCRHDCTGVFGCYWKMMEENDRLRAAYIKAGVCSQCGACSADEAEKKCTATRDITDEYSCAGEDLWMEESSKANAIGEARAESASSPQNQTL